MGNVWKMSLHINESVKKKGLNDGTLGMENEGLEFNGASLE